MQGLHGWGIVSSLVAASMQQTCVSGLGGRGSGSNRPSASEVVPRIGALLVEGVCFAGRLLLIADA